MKKASVLIIDDEPGIRNTLASILEDEGYKVFTVEDAAAGFEVLKKENAGMIFLDVLLPGMGGIEALEIMRRDCKNAEIVMISGHANVDIAVRAVKLGAFDFLEKPLSLDKVLTVCRNALELHSLKEENLKLKSLNVKDEFLGTSPEIQKVKELIRQAAASDARILITGENGSGKELAARAIHRFSGRADKPFVELNCAAIPDNLIESELFGHEKGAFTDAVSSRKGRFETASGGTLFLDEVGDMSLPAQAKVLRAIQEQRIERLGGEKTVEVDVRIVAATNKNLEQKCKEGRFREDLYFRLNVIPLNMPPLRERTGDIRILLLHFLEEFTSYTPELTKEVLDYLSSYPWPGNVRELKNFAQRIAVIYGEKPMGVEDAAGLLQNRGAKSSNGDALPPFPMSEILGKNFSDAKESFEKYFLECKLSQNHGIITHTAEAIGIYPSNLHAKMKKYGLQAAKE